MYTYVYTHAYARKQVLSACHAISSVLIMTGSSEQHIVCLDGSFINWLWPLKSLNRPKQLYASEQLKLSAWYAVSSALKRTCISERKTKTVATVCLAPSFGQSTGQITLQPRC